MSAITNIILSSRSKTFPCRAHLCMSDDEKRAKIQAISQRINETQVCLEKIRVVPIDFYEYRVLTILLARQAFRNSQRLSN